MRNSSEGLQTRIKELESALEEAKANSGNETEIDEAIALAEKAFAEKEQLELVIERQKQMLTDLQLKATVELLNKEIEVATLQADVAKLSGLQEANKDKEAVIHQLEQQIRNYEKTFESLKKVCIESATQSRALEAQLSAQVNHSHDLESHLVECQFLLQEHVASLESYQQMEEIDRELLLKSQELEQFLKASLRAKEKELESYKEAFDQLSRISIEKEASRASEISGMKSKIQSLEKTVQRNASYLAPRWQRLADDKAANKVGSNAAAQLRSRNVEIDSLMLGSERKFFISCIPPELWSREIEVHNIAASLARVVFKGDNFLEFVFEAHYNDLVADVEENPLSVEKDKGFIRWLNNSIGVTSSIMAKCSILLEAFRGSTFAEIKDFLALGDSALGGDLTNQSQFIGDCELLTYLKSGENHFERLLISAENDYLSSSFDLGMLESFESSLEGIIRKGKQDSKLSSAVSAVHCIGTSGDFGILPPVLSAAIRKLGSLAVMGLCRAAYTDSASLAISEDVWKGLWQAATHIIERLPFGRRASPGSQVDCLSIGFGLCPPTKRANNKDVSQLFLDKTLTAIKKIEAELCATDDAAASDIAARITEQLPSIGTSLEKLDQMCKTFSPPRKLEDKLAPWEEAVELVLSRVCGITEVEQTLVQLQNSQQRRENELNKSTSEVVKARQECNEWRAKFSELTLEIERMSLYENELKELRASDAHYIKLVASQRIQVSQLEKQKNAMDEKNLALSAKLNEASSILEATRCLPRHQHQSDWDAVEIASLRAINTKLEREILALNVEKVEVDLDPSDLIACLPLTSASLWQDDVTETSDPDAARRNRELVAYNQLRKLVDDYRCIRGAVLEHMMRAPLLNVSCSFEEATEVMKKYMSEQSALHLKLSILQTKLDNLSTPELGSQTIHRFVKGMLTVKDEAPSVCITVPQAPWPTSTNRVCRLAATTEQLAELHRKILGVD